MKPLRYESGRGSGANLPTVLAIAFFSVSVALENTASMLFRLPASLPTISAIALLLAYLLFFPLRRNSGKPDPAIRWLLVFAAITAIGEMVRFWAFGESQTSAYFNTGLMYIKLLAVFYILDRMVSQSVALYKWLTYSWVITLSVLALLAVLRIGWISYDMSGRVGLRGENLNIAGHRWAGAAAGIAILMIKKRRMPTRVFLALSLLVAILVVAAFRSGSRGASIALVTGLLVFLGLDAELNLRKVMRYAVFALALGVVLYVTFLHTDVLVNRWSTTIDDQDPGVRGHLFTESVKMILENPILGCGSAYDVQLGARLNRAPIVSHNTLTQVFLITGVVAFIPFAFGIIMIFRKARKHTKTPLSAAVFGALLCAFSSSLFGNWAHLKYFWLILILAENSSILEATLDEPSTGDDAALKATELKPMGPRYG